MMFIKEQVANQVTSGVFITSGSEVAAELAGTVGFDWALLDMEHGLGDEAATLGMIRVLCGTHTAPIVRIPILRDDVVKRVLDFGAAGIMCPMIKTVDEAKELVSAMRYPPDGRRGMASSSRAADYGNSFKDYYAKANSDLLCIVQIETREALEDIDAIAAVDGVDVLFIGHSDLSLALGCFGDFDGNDILQAEAKVTDAAIRHGKTAGMLLKQSMDVDVYRKRGFQFLALGTDTGCLRSSFTALRNRIG